MPTRDIAVKKSQNYSFCLACAAATAVEDGNLLNHRPTQLSAALYCSMQLDINS